MSRKGMDLALAAGLALVALVLVLLVPERNAARALAAMTLVLVLPGFALTAAVFPRPTISGTERLLLSTGMSLAIVVLSGLLLNLLPGGLQTTSWALLLVFLTLAGCAVAFLRRRSLAPATSRWSFMLGWRNAAIFGLAGVVLALALGVSANGVLNQPSAGFTQLWLLPSENSATTLRVGVANKDRAPLRYILRVEAAGRTLQEWPLELKPGADWEQTLTLPADLPATARVDAQLFRPDLPGVYREAWVDRGQQ